MLEVAGDDVVGTGGVGAFVEAVVFNQSHKSTQIVNPRQYLELLAGTHGEK